MRLNRVIISSLAASALLLTASTAPANAAGPRSYKNCTELNKVYPHGVGKSGARDKTSGRPVTNYRVNNTVYSYNDGGWNRHTGERDLDRDNDGIACEKR